MAKRFLLGLLAISLILTGFEFSVRAQETNTIILATTTSVRDTGLLDVLVERFHKKTGYTVKSIAVGTGQALQMGKHGEADILWVHSPDEEIQFVNEGYGTDRTTFAHNDFVLLGPQNDPAKIKGIKKASSAFKIIAEAGVLFISRGDQSGTHKKELRLWKDAGVQPKKENYIEAGQGMAATLNMANEKQSYILADRSTYLSLKKNIELLILSEGDDALLNKYSLILVNPAKFVKVNAKGARVFFDFVLSKETKDIIDNFGKDKFGGQLFFYDYKVK